MAQQERLVKRKFLAFSTVVNINPSRRVFSTQFRSLTVNPSGEFVTGFDPMSAEAKYRRQLRMKRFGKHEKVETSKLDDTVTGEERSVLGDGT